MTPRQAFMIGFRLGLFQVSAFGGIVGEVFFAVQGGWLMAGLFAQASLIGFAGLAQERRLRS